MIPRDVRYTMLVAENKLSIRKQCELLCITRTKYYYKPQPEILINLHIMRIMDEQYLRTPFYGFRRMFENVKKSCPMWILNKKRVERLYNKMGLRSVLPGPNTSKSDTKVVRKFPYLLKKLKIEKNNQVWAKVFIFLKRIQ